MRTRKIAGIILSFLILTFIFPAMQTNASSNTLVSYTCDPEDIKHVTFPMVVTVTGNGYLKDGDATIGSGSLEYNLPLGSKKYFTIAPEQGYELVGLYLRRAGSDVKEDILDRVDANQRFWIIVEETEVEVIAEFAEIDDGGDTGGSGGSGGSGSTGGSSGSGGSDSTNNPDDTGGDSGGSTGTTSSGSTSGAGTTSAAGSNTGDSAQTGCYLIMMLIAASAMVGLAAKKNKKVYKES